MHIMESYTDAARPTGTPPRPGRRGAVTGCWGENFAMYSLDMRTRPLRSDQHDN